MAGDIGPCPYCGGDNLSAVTDPSELTLTSPDGAEVVILPVFGCEDCGTEWPLEDLVADTP
jgi:hypothetical protein